MAPDRGNYYTFTKVDMIKKEQKANRAIAALTLTD
jgi:hypothetical protein